MLRNIIIFNNMSKFIYNVLLTFEIFVLTIFTTITIIFYNKIKFNLIYTFLYIISQIISLVCQIYYLTNYDSFYENSHIYNDITYGFNLIIIFMYGYYIKRLSLYYREITIPKYYETFNDIL